MSNHCTKWGCDYAPLKYLKKDATIQTNNGFFVIKVKGWYCPNCGAGYGDYKVDKKRNVKVFLY